jgi:hypothetical protein
VLPLLGHRFIRDPLAVRPVGNKWDAPGRVAARCLNPEQAEWLVEFRKTDYNRIQAADDIAKAGLPMESALRLLTKEDEKVLRQKI